MKEKKTIRQFSEAFKIEKVKMLENKQVTVRQLSKIYNVSGTAIYNWIRRYSTKIEKLERVVLEKESEGAKTLELMNQLVNLERMVGLKQIEIEYLNKLIELSSEELGVDIKKKFASKHLLGLGQKKNDKG